MMNLHRKKMLPPIVVSVIIILYYVVYFGILMLTPVLKCKKTPFENCSFHELYVMPTDS